MSFSQRAVAHAALIAAGAGSLVLSAMAVARAPIVNNDGARYLAAAQAYAESGLAGAERVYPWPFYSALISLAAQADGSPIAAARVINAVLLALTAVAFVAIVRELGADTRLQWVAAGLVLSHPMLTRLRPELVRDFGLWACILIGLLALLRFGRQGSYRYAAAWAACGALALLFRPEAVIVWAIGALAPLLDSTLPLRRRAARVCALQVVPVCALIAALTFLQVPVSLVPAQLGLLTGGFESGARALAAGFPYPYGREYAPYILLWGLTAIPPVKIVLAMGGAQAILSGIGAARGMGSIERRTLWLAAAASAVPMLFILPVRLSLETRYAVPCSLILLAFAPFGLARLLRGGKRGAAGAAVLATLVVVGWVRDINATESQELHLQAAGEWLREHTPAGARLRTNSPQVAYYSQRRVDWNEVESLLLGEGPSVEGAPTEYVAMLLPKADDAVPPRAGTNPTGELVATFAGENGERVLIYRSGPHAPYGP
jgi:hypothetical protein